ncbi:hypothetical protein INR49_006921 [Caranx melampygus]|nr:hypothetical protein INR49_006921 [Caranx melampygus]
MAPTPVSLRSPDSQPNLHRAAALFYPPCRSALARAAPPSRPRREANGCSSWMSRPDTLSVFV